MKQQLAKTILFLILIGGAFPANATLGGQVDTIESDKVAISGSQHTIKNLNALKNTSPRRIRGAHMITKSSSVVVEKSGHLRGMKGRAFVPGLIPTGVSSNEIL
jgi:hypothetical protein